MGTCPRCGGLVIFGLCQDCMYSPGEDAAVRLPDLQWDDASLDGVPGTWAVSL
jgi:hypothetical protein